MANRPPCTTTTARETATPGARHPAAMTETTTRRARVKTTDYMHRKTDRHVHSTVQSRHDVLIRCQRKHAHVKKTIREALLEAPRPAQGRPRTVTAKAIATA